MISLLVPYREDESGTRKAVWTWLREFYETYLPDAEIVVGHYDGTPYSKSAAVNDAAARASGDAFVILDADTLIDPHVITTRAALTTAYTPAWFIPHERAYRLTQRRTELYLKSDLASPVRPLPEEVEDQIDDAPGFIQVLSRRAFETVGGMDPRFCGWGGEDSSFVRAVDTLYMPHLRTGNYVLHLWHDRPGAGSSQTRRWDGQEARVRTLWRAYRRASGDPRAMRALVDEGLGRRERARLPVCDPAAEHHNKEP